MNGKRNPITILALALLVLALAGGPNLAQGPDSASGVSVAPLDSAASAPLGAGFTYQGLLKRDGNPVTDTCDFQFSLYDGASLGTQIGSTQTIPGVNVADGLFTVQVNAGGQFGANAFNGEARWLEIAVRCPTGGSGGYTSLGRQALTAAPYARYAPQAGAANTAITASSAPWSGLTGMPAGFADGVDNDTTYTAGDGLELVGAQFRGRGTSYQNVVIVAKSGGDFTSVQAALDSITSASDANRYLVWVAPGVYTETVTMKPYVDIEGAGELLTTLSYTGSASFNTGTVVGANDAELRFLTVRNTGGNNWAIPIYNNSASPRLTHVTASALGEKTNCGVWNSSSSPTMMNVTASASGGAIENYGVHNDHSSPTMTNVTASASGGTLAVTINQGVYNYYSSPTMTNVTASVSGGYRSSGVNNYSSSPTMTNVTASASGGTTNVGVSNAYHSSPMMNYVTASASGGTTNYGVENYTSSPTIRNSVIFASGGTSDGLHNTAPMGGSYTITINASQITGGTSTIYQDSQYTTRVGASQLAGGGAFGGTYVCVASYNGDYFALNNSCKYP